MLQQIVPSRRSDWGTVLTLELFTLWDSIPYIPSDCNIIQNETADTVAKETFKLKSNCYRKDITQQCHPTHKQYLTGIWVQQWETSNTGRIYFTVLNRINDITIYKGLKRQYQTFVATEFTCINSKHQTARFVKTAN